MVSVRNSLRSIQRLILDNPPQQRNFKSLVELTEKRISLMDEAIALKRSGHGTLEGQVAITRQIVATADATDQILQSMDESEADLLVQRQDRERRSFEVIAGVLATSLFLAMILFLIHHQLLTDQVRERVRAEAAQRALSARLLTLQDEERRRFAPRIARLGGTTTGRDEDGAFPARKTLARGRLGAGLPEVARRFDRGDPYDFSLYYIRRCWTKPA